MPKNRQNPHKPAEKTNPQSSRSLLAFAFVAGILVYTFAFFSLPSSLGFAREDQAPLPRWVDLSMLLLWDEILAGLAGNGRFETGILDRIPLVIAGITWLTIAGCIGRWLIGCSKLASQFTRIELTALAVLAGLAILSTATLLVGLLGGLHSRWPLLLAIAVIAIMCAALERFSRTHSNTPTSSRAVAVISQTIAPTSLLGIWTSRLLPVATLAMAGILVLGSLVTPHEFDVVEYHLQAPKEFYLNGFIGFNAHNVYANMPLGSEMHSLAAMTLIGGEQGWWWGGLIGKFIIGSVSIIAAALVGGFVSRHLGKWSGWAAAGLLLSVPGNTLVSMAGLIDSVVGAYILAMAVVLATTLRQQDVQSGIFLSSLFAGAAAACKYTGFVFAVIPLLVVLCAMVWKTRPRIPGQLKIAGAVAAGLCVTCVPWLAKNLIQAENPVFPLAASILGGKGMDAARIEQWNAAHAVPHGEVSAYGLSSLAGSAKQLWLDSPLLSPTLIPLAACGIAICVARKLSSEKNANRDQAAVNVGHWPLRWLGLAVWILAVWWLATHRIDRFWLPVLPLYAALAAVGIAWLGSALSVTFASSLVLLSIAYGGLLAVSGTLSDNRFLVRLDELRQDAGDDEFPGRLSPTTQWINEHLTEPNVKLLLVGEARVFDFKPTIEYATCFNDNPAEVLLKGQSAGEQKANLRQQGITHLMIHWAEIRRYRSPGNYGFSSWPQRSDIEGLLQQSVVERVDWPFEPERAELLRVLE